MRRCHVHRIGMRHPGDVSKLMSLLSSGVLQASSIKAIFGKTEGNGCVNDFTRGYAVSALQSALAGALEVSPSAVADRIAMVMSGGTEGGLSPHFLVFSVSEDPAASFAPTITKPRGKGLAMAHVATRTFLPEEIGRLAQVQATAAAVRQAMSDASIENPSDVHYVQIKCPLLTSERMAEAQARGVTTVTHDTYASMGFSRGASALGVAVALNEVPAVSVNDAAVCNDFGLWSARASASAGIELMRNEVIVLGNSPDWSPETSIGHGVMQDAIDLPAVHAVLGAAGLATHGQLDARQRSRIVAILCKAEASRSGHIRGARHIMWDDSDVHATRHARALVGGVVAAAIGRTDLFVSGGAEHQGPDGGGPIAIIVQQPVHE